MRQNIERELPMLAGIAAFLRWWEELLNIVNGPILLFGAGIALVDLLTDGRLTTTASIFLFAWAVSQALGIDTQLLGCFARARKAHSWSRFGWLVLGVILAIAAWQAGYVYAVQQSAHISEAQALDQLGIPAPLWLAERAALAVGLVALSGWTRYVAPHMSASIADEQAKLERELTLEPLRQRLRVQQAGGVRAIAGALVGTKQNVQSDTNNAPEREHVTEEPPAPDPIDPPSGPGTPAAHPVEQAETLADMFPSATIETVAATPAETVAIEEPAPAVLVASGELPTQATASSAPTSEPAADGNAERKTSVDADTKRTLAFGLMQEYPELRENTTRLIAELRTRIGEGVRHDTAATWQRQFKRSGAISTIADVRTPGTVRAVK